MAEYYVYMMTNKNNTVLYTGMTGRFEERMHEHKTGAVTGFTQKYACYKLVYFEEYEDFDSAYMREQRIKKWKRAWKDNLIEKENPYWKDLTESWYDD